MGHFILSVKHEFSAARALRDYDGKCGNVHGHNYKVTVKIATHETDKGYVLDFYEIKLYLAEILEKYDLSYLNELSPFDKINPTTENIAKWLFEQLLDYVVEKQAFLKTVKVSEGDDFSATYSPNSFPTYA